jgi:serine/threonine protein kinase
MRICPGCRASYDESVHTCPRDGLPLLEVSRTFAQLKEGEEPPAPEVEANEAVVRRDMMIGEYMVERTIAEGGMGAIYAGIHPVISKRVAIKVISKRFAKDPKAVARFVLEARSVNQIGHHNIVDIFSIGELDDGRNYLIMELLDGLGLHHILLNLKRLKPGEVIPVYEQLCDALEAAHGKGFIHRDLKPDNIIVLRRPPFPFIKILDFGLAKLRGSAVSHNTEVGTVLGTPEYMAPEQCRGSAVDARTDIYALGVMLYELITGRKPFTDSSPLRILAMQQRNAPLPPSRIAPIPKMLELVVLKAMAKDPDQRYPTVRALLTDLRRAIPEAIPWTATHLASVGKQESSPTVPPDMVQPDPQPRQHAPIPGKVEALQPLSISGEMTPASGEMELEDDNVKTLVSDRYGAPLAMSGEMVPQEVEDEAATEVDALDEPSPSDVKRPAPAFFTPPFAEMGDMVDPTQVDDPIVLVDRPIRETRTSEQPAVNVPPPAEERQRAVSDIILPPPKEAPAPRPARITRPPEPVESGGRAPAAPPPKEPSRSPSPPAKDAARPTGAREQRSTPPKDSGHVSTPLRDAGRAPTPAKGVSPRPPSAGKEAAHAVTAPVEDNVEISFGDDGGDAATHELAMQQMAMGKTIPLATLPEQFGKPAPSSSADTMLTTEIVAPRAPKKAPPRDRSSGRSARKTQVRRKLQLMRLLWLAFALVVTAVAVVLIIRSI